jgi:DNA-binding LacI/PurR family transcriptional regulator
VILDDMFAQGYLSALQRLGIRVGRDLQVASTVNAESPSLLAWDEQIVSVRFSVLEIARVMHTAMDALRQGEEPADSWEQATWNLETGGPFRVAMLIPKVYVPEEIRQCINTIKH